MNQYKFRFTLFTPCYNSARFFDRIVRSVGNQTFRDFEWIVVNDCSSDNTLDLLQAYIKTVDFPVKLINNDKNMMLAVNYNLAVEQTEGELFVTLDHDDEYSPHYLEIMNSLYMKYDSPTVAGIVARCQTQFGKVTPIIAYSKPLMNWFEYGHDKSGRYTGEVPRAFKTEILRKYMPFDPKLVHNPLIEAMMSYDGYEFITSNEIIRKYYVFEETHSSISNTRSNKLALYKWTRAYDEINKYTKMYHTSFPVKLRLWIMYGCASIRLGLPFREMIGRIDRWKIAVVLAYPLSYLRIFLSDIPLVYSIWARIRSWRYKLSV